MSQGRKSLSEILGTDSDVPKAMNQDRKPLEEILKDVPRYTTGNVSNLLTPEAEKQEKPGFFQNLVRGIADTPLKIGVSAKQLVSGTGSLIKAGFQSLTGNKEGAKDTIKGASERIGQPEDLGYFGKVSPLGVDEAGNPLSTLDAVKQGAGAGAEVASYLVGGSGAVGLKGAGTQTAKQLIKRGAISGAEAGGLGGLGSGLQSIVGSKESAPKQALEVVKDTAVGTGLGAVIGAGTGVITAKVKGKDIFPKSDKNLSKDTWEVIQPNLTPTERAKAVAQGKIKSSGILKTVEQVPKGRDLEMIEAAKPYVSKVSDPIHAVSNMKQGITDEANKLRAGLAKSQSIWNRNELKGAINSIERPHLLSGDLEKSFDKTLSVVLDQAENSDKKLSGLLDVRKNFDRVVEEQYPNLYDSESMTAIKQAVTKTRNAINDLIEKKLPEGVTLDGVSFRDSLKKQSLLYSAIDNTAPKVPKVGSNIFDRIGQRIKKNPISSLIGAGVAGYGTAEGIKKLTGN